MKKTVITALGVLSFVCAFAQNQQVIQDGTSFINGLAPTKAGDVVNASGVNSQKWSGQTSTGNTTPKGLGTFSNPTTSPDMFNQAKLVGLTGMGNNAMTRCENYVPSGDGVKDQECAAVNFLSQRCLQPAGNQTNIINANGGLQASSAACNGSYGQGANKFDFASQLKSTDSVFSLTNSAVKNAGNTTGQVCSEKLVVTKPAETETNNCFKSTSTNQEVCSQVLRVTGCDPLRDGCASGGIIPNTTSVSNGAYSFGFDGFNLNLINAITAVYTRTEANFNFTINGVDRISEFRVTGIHSDNWVGFSINGNYVGTHSRGIGGFSTSSNQLAIETVESCWDSGEWGSFCSTSNYVRYSPTATGYVETGNNLYTNENYDVRRFLREGANVITMYVINGGGPGYGIINMRVNQYCPRNCYSAWENQCTSQEARSGFKLGTP